MEPNLEHFTCGFGNLVQTCAILQYDLGEEGDMFKANEPVIEEPAVGLHPMRAAVSIFSCGEDIISPKTPKVVDIESIQSEQLLSEVFYECKKDFVEKEDIETTLFDVLDIEIPAVGTEENAISKDKLFLEGSFQKSVSSGCLSSMEWTHGAPMRPEFFDFPGMDLGAVHGMRKAFSEGDMKGNLVQTCAIWDYDLGGEGDLFKAKEPIIEEPAVCSDPMTASNSMFFVAEDIISPKTLTVTDIESIQRTDENLISEDDFCPEEFFQKSVSSGCLSSTEWIHGAPMRPYFLDFPGMDLGAVYGMRRALSEGDIKTLGNGSVSLLHSPLGLPPSISNCTTEDRRQKLSRYRNKKIKRKCWVTSNQKSHLSQCGRNLRNKEAEFLLRKQTHLCNEKRDSGNETYPSKSRSLQLQFLHKLSIPVLTGTKIKGAEVTSVGIALFDGLTGQVVNTGPEASAKVEIVVLEKDFNGDERDNWSLQEFNSKIVTEGEDKKSLLTGDVYLNLKQGIGLIGDVCFRHTKCWMRRNEFRLGARTVDGSQGVRVREATTEPFIVKDRRLKLNEKHYPPSLSDAVWRLEKISKDGAFHKRLSKENINTVKDFVTLLHITPQRLKDILGTSMSVKLWETIVDHARTCTLDQRLYLYCFPGSLQKTGVVFNVVGEVRGLISECKYVSMDKLSESEKVDSLKLVISAFTNWEDVVPIDDGASLFNDSYYLPNVLYPSNPVITDNSDGNKILTSHSIQKSENQQLGPSSHDFVPSIYSQ